MMNSEKKIVKAGDHKCEKYVLKLKEPAKRAKQALQDALEKSVKRFHDQAKKSTSEREKSLYLKKTEKISNDLDVLKVLPEDEIVRYALSVSDKIMLIASNPRMPRELRMKARVAAHKPLCTHLSQLKKKLSDSQESASDSESEDEGDGKSSTLNKITFNNTIVLMRKDVRRAKVRIIHKLTRNIKKLREAKGNESKVLKNQKKAARLHNKVIHIKELLEDDASKFALSTTQNPYELVNDIKAPMSSQALATVAINPFVAAHVKKFKSQYPDWQKTVPNLLKKKKKKRKLSLEAKDGGNNSDVLPQAKGESDGDHSGSDNESENEEDSESVGKESENTDEDAENAESHSESAEEGSESGDEEDTDLEDDATSQVRSVEKYNSNSGVEVPNSSQNKPRNGTNLKNENPKKIKTSAEDNRGESKTISSIKISKNREKRKEMSPTPVHVEDKPKVVDPFFVTSTNEEYVTSQAPISNGGDSSSERVKDSESFKSRKFSKNIWEKMDDDEKHFNRFQKTAPYKKPNSRSFDKYTVNTRTDKLVFGNRKERRKALHQPQVEEKVEKLHPSWEAKKKQSSIIPFQGKKVTFD